MLELKRHGQHRPQTRENRDLVGQYADLIRLPQNALCWNAINCGVFARFGRLGISFKKLLRIIDCSLTFPFRQAIADMAEHSFDA